MAELISTGPRLLQGFGVGLVQRQEASMHAVSSSAPRRRLRREGANSVIRRIPGVLCRRPWVHRQCANTHVWWGLGRRLVLRLQQLTRRLVLGLAFGERSGARVADVSEYRERQCCNCMHHTRCGIDQDAGRGFYEVLLSPFRHVLQSLLALSEFITRRNKQADAQNRNETKR